MWKPHKPYPEEYMDEEIVLTLWIHNEDTYKDDIPDYDFVRAVEFDISDHTEDKVGTKIEFVKKHYNEYKYKQGLLDYEVKVKQYREYLENKIKDVQKQLKFMGV